MAEPLVADLRKLVHDVGGRVSLHAGCIADPDSSCECRYILDEGHAGGIATIHVNNGIPSIADGGNDCPSKPLAIAYMNLLVGAANALPALIQIMEERDRLRDRLKALQS